MSEQLDNDAPVGDAPPATGGGPSWFTKISVIAFIGTIVVAECLAAIVLLPSKEETQEMAEEQLANEVSTNPDPEAVEEEEAREKPRVEVPIGDFSVTAYQPVSNTTLRVDFELFGEVIRGEEGEFASLYGSCKHRFREQVIVTVRNSDIADLTDPGLGLIKRKILEKVNRQLGKPILKGVVFSEFSFVEQ